MRITQDGVGIEFDDVGDGPPVLLLHGFPDSARLWRHQVPALTANGFRSLVPDQRGYGRSDKPADVRSYGLITIALDAIAVLDAAEVERAHIVGHDWGAVIGWLLASMFPDRVDCFAAFSVGNPAVFQAAGIAQLQKSWYMLLFQFPDVAETWLRANDWQHFREWAAHPDADAVIADLEATGALTPALNWYRANTRPELFIQPPPELPLVDAPVMGVWSSDDIACTETQMLLSASTVRGPWRYERLDGVGHWIPLEAPERTTELLLDFLGSRPSR